MLRPKDKQLQLGVGNTLELESLSAEMERTRLLRALFCGLNSAVAGLPAPQTKTAVVACAQRCPGRDRVPRFPDTPVRGPFTRRGWPGSGDVTARELFAERVTATCCCLKNKGTFLIKTDIYFWSKYLWRCNLWTQLTSNQLIFLFSAFTLHRAKIIGPVCLLLVCRCKGPYKCVFIE